MQARPELTAEWTKYNLVYLAGFAIENYGLVTNFPLTKMEDLNGKRLGGAGPNLAWLRNTGAVGVQGSLNTFYNDIKTGVYDGAVAFITAAVPAKLFEIAPHYTVVDMGAMYAGAVAINKSRWDKFPDEVKAAFKKGADAYKQAYLKEQTARIAGATEAWSKSGGKMSTLPASEQARHGQGHSQPDGRLGQAGRCDRRSRCLTEYMDAVRATGFKFPRDFDKE